MSSSNTPATHVPAVIPQTGIDESVAYIWTCNIGEEQHSARRPGRIGDEVAAGLAEAWYCSVVSM